MTVKELFKKMDIYNECAELMRTEKAQIYFEDTTIGLTFGDSFKTYEEFRKHIRKEYFKNVADQILSGKDWDFEKKISVAWMGHDYTFQIFLVGA